MKILKQDDIKSNYAALAKQLGFDYRTVTKYYDRNLDNIVNKPPKPSILNPYKDIVEDKVKLSCTVTSIYKFIQKKGYKRHLEPYVLNDINKIKLKLMIFYHRMKSFLKN